MKMNKAKDSRPFSERHPRWNLVLGLLLILILIGLGLLLLYCALARLKSEIADAEAQMEKYLKELGL